MKQVKRIVEGSLQAVTLMALLLTIVWTPVVLEQGSESLQTLSFRKGEVPVKQVLPLVNINDQIEEEQTEHPEDVVPVLYFPTHLRLATISEVFTLALRSDEAEITPAKVPAYLRLRKLLI